GTTVRGAMVHCEGAMVRTSLRSDARELERIFNADKRRDLVAQSAIVESGQEVSIEQQPPGKVDLKPDGAAQLIDVSRLESNVGKNRSAVERMEVCAANDRRIDDVAAQNVERYRHARVDGYDRTDGVDADVREIGRDTRLEIAGQDARPVPLI